MKIKNTLLTIITFTLLIIAFASFKTNVHAMSASDANPNNTVYDMSEWQSYWTDTQVQQLKQEVPFVIIRAQNGSMRYDYTFQHNRDLLEKYNVPYGVYSFSLYTSPEDAANEARTLYSRAPHARFYVNDYEENDLTSGDPNTAAQTWVDTLRPLVGQRKVLYYGPAWLMLRDTANAISSYDGYWLPAYQDSEPQREHVLWQFTSNFYSNALGKNIDASLLDSKDANWFIGDTADANAQPTPIDNDANSSQANNQSNNAQQSNNQNQSNDSQNNTSKSKPRNTTYTQQSKTMIIKDGYDYQIYNHVPLDNKFSDNIYAKASVSDYTHKRVYINSIANVNGRSYYRLYYKNHVIGWVNTRALVPNLNYSSYYVNKTMKNNPKVAFHNHINNSGFASRITNHGYSYANKKLKITSRAIKDGWHSYYYKAYYRGKLLGWIYQSAFK
ncbi:GH25 family lysozyme [Apilactobacillus quenuiae]|uniref:GH25 family lysozyme n=1 Tax=Apilactobacillus quenuiae TaxID=2008377 RepID=UPI000D0168DB|nr:GH25 family lysozyme [Apilactobacillus quenuiae]